MSSDVPSIQGANACPQEGVNDVVDVDPVHRARSAREFRPLAPEERHGHVGHKLSEVALPRPVDHEHAQVNHRELVEGVEEARIGERGLLGDGVRRLGDGLGIAESGSSIDPARTRRPHPASAQASITLMP